MSINKNQHLIWVCIACLVLLISNPALAESANSPLESNPKIQVIQQPARIKAIVTIVGLGLIGLELWWFIYSKYGNKSNQ